MRILAVDDELLARESLEIELKKVFSGAQINTFGKQSEVLSWLMELDEQGEILDYAFLDISLRGTTGILLAQKIKEFQPNTKMIFCTGYSEYAYEAYKLHAIGYLLKPVMAEQIMETIDAVNKSWQETAMKGKCIVIQTFGDFEVFANDQLIDFESEKQKELLAYLVDRHGAAVTIAEMASVLWNETSPSRTVISQAHGVLTGLKKSMKKADIDYMLIKTWNHTAVDISKFKCDVYDFFEGDALAVNSFHGEYMNKFKWAELTNKEIKNRAMRRKQV